MAKAPKPDEPHVARWLRPLLFVLLAGSALVAIGIEPMLVRRVAASRLPAAALFAPVALYAAFFTLYAVDRWLLVQRRRYPPGRAFFQIVFGLVFGLLLLPSTLHEWAEARPGEAALARHHDARVRLVYAEALGFRGPTPEHVRVVRRMWTEDADEDVQNAARRVLARWAGANADDAIRDWADAFLLPTPGPGDDP